MEDLNMLFTTWRSKSSSKEMMNFQKGLFWLDRFISVLCVQRSLISNTYCPDPKESFQVLFVLNRGGKSLPAKSVDAPLLYPLLKVDKKG